jgi:hypothetical protein
MCRVIRVADLAGAAREFVLGLRDRENWDTMPLADLDEALGLTKSGVASGTTTVEPITEPVAVVRKPLPYGGKR